MVQMIFITNRNNTKIKTITPKDYKWYSLTDVISHNLDQ